MRDVVMLWQPPHPNPRTIQSTIFMAHFYFLQLTEIFFIGSERARQISFFTNPNEKDKNKKKKKFLTNNFVLDKKGLKKTSSIKQLFLLINSSFIYTKIKDFQRDNGFVFTLVLLLSL